MTFGRAWELLGEERKKGGGGEGTRTEILHGPTSANLCANWHKMLLYVRVCVHSCVAGTCPRLTGGRALPSRTARCVRNRDKNFPLSLSRAGLSIYACLCLSLLSSYIEVRQAVVPAPCCLSPHSKPPFFSLHCSTKQAMEPEPAALSAVGLNGFMLLLLVIASSFGLALVLATHAISGPGSGDKPFDYCRPRLRLLGGGRNSKCVQSHHLHHYHMLLLLLARCHVLLVSLVVTCCRLSSLLSLSARLFTCPGAVPHGLVYVCMCCACECQATAHLGGDDIARGGGGDRGRGLGGGAGLPEHRLAYIRATAYWPSAIARPYAEVRSNASREPLIKMKDTRRRVAGFNLQTRASWHESSVPGS